MTPTAAAAALAHLRRHDPTLAAVARTVGVPPARPARPARDDFAHLCRIIAGQQLSTKAAAAIWTRVGALAPRFTPQAVAALPLTALRGCGLSGAKARFIAEAAQRVAAGEIDLAAIRRLDDDTAGERLRALAGFGPWSVQMYLIFALGRPDVFSVGDGGLRRAIALLYGERALSARGLEALTARWRPHRTAAALWLWAWLDAGQPAVAVPRARRRAAPARNAARARV